MTEEKKTAEKKATKKKVEVTDEPGYTPKVKPKLTDERRSGLTKRSKDKAKKPDFKRQEWFRYKRVGESWRKPRGMHSKMRKHLGYRINVASIGYSSPNEVKGLHPSGFEEVMVFRPKDLEPIDPKLQAARIGHSVGTKKRAAIEERADELGIRVLNRRR